jgi:hypothetical protein
MASENSQVADGASEVIQEGSVLRRTADGWSVGDEDLPDLTCAMVLADLIAAELPDSGAPDAGAERPGRLATTGGADKATGRGDGATARPVTIAVTRPGAAAADAAAADTAARAGAAADTAARAGAAAGAGAAAASPAGAGAARDAAAGDEGSHEEAQRLRVTVSQLERALAVRIRVEQAIGVLAERHRVRPRQAFEQLRSAARARGQRVIDIAGDVIASATNPLLPLPEELSRPNLAQRQRAGNRRRAREGQ